MGKLIHVDFGKKSTRLQEVPPRRPQGMSPTNLGYKIANFDIMAPWILRLMAVAATLILSMLIL